MPRRIRDYLDRLSHRDTNREETNPYTVNTTVNLNDLEWHPVRWNATQWFPSDDVPNMEVRAATRQMLENAYNNMTVREYEELASRRTASNDFAVPENMLRLVRMSMPNINRNELVEERPMDTPNDDWISRATRVPASYFSADYNEPITHTPYWSNKTIRWNWGDKCHVEYRRGKIIRVKRYCKI